MNGDQPVLQSEWLCGGLTKREWLSGMCLKALLSAQPPVPEKELKDSAKEMAKQAITYSEALIKALDKAR